MAVHPKRKRWEDKTHTKKIYYITSPAANGFNLLTYLYINLSPARNSYCNNYLFFLKINNLLFVLN